MFNSIWAVLIFIFKTIKSIKQNTFQLLFEILFYVINLPPPFDQNHCLCKEYYKKPILKKTFFTF
jgi:hypothetical protein